MKPAWDKLMAEYEQSSTILVADVDCTQPDGKPKCEEAGVRGFPTIKYGDPEDLQDYKGGRDFDSLKKLADGLGPSCSPGNLDLCDEAKKKSIQEFTALGQAKREEMIAEKEAEITKAESDFKAFLESLQQQYKEASEKKEKAVEEVKNSGLGLLKAVSAFEKKKKTEL